MVKLKIFIKNDNFIFPYFFFQNQFLDIVNFHKI